MLHKIRRAMRDRDYTFQLAGIVGIDDSFSTVQHKQKVVANEVEALRKTAVIVEGLPMAMPLDLPI